MIYCVSERPFGLVLGNEEHGLPPATLAACDEIVTIPEVRPRSGVTSQIDRSFMSAIGG
jgi:hypothetical protein